MDDPAQQSGLPDPRHAVDLRATHPHARPGDPRWTHLLIEAYRAMMTERNDVVADPDFAPLAPESLLDPERLATFAKQIRPDAVTTHPRPAPKAGRHDVHVRVDGDGMGVSLIESNFRGIGSGIGSGDSGFILHDRGGGFDLRPGHPNEIAAGKRPLHTLSPTLWTKGSRLRTLLGTRGGYQQPQLLAQVAALCSPPAAHPATRRPNHAGRSRTSPGRHPSSTSSPPCPPTSLTAFAPTVTQSSRSPAGSAGWGPVSIIDIDESGLRTAASDPRVDTAAAAVR
jgi:gamma-glutamyltranspeptidase / glutathione hydrolase